MIAKTEPALESNSDSPVAQFLPEIYEDAFDENVIVIVGGSNGVGASLVELCCQNGAYVAIGDIDTTQGEQLVKKCLQTWPVYSDPALPPKPPRATFQQTDVTDYQSVLNLFERTFNKYNRIDHVVVTAGSMDTGENWFEHTLNFQDVKKAPSRRDLDVNLIGTLYVTRVASVYLRHNRGPGVDRSILLFSCAAGFKETPGVSVYQAAKHGVQGLMRSLRANFSSPYKHSIRINTICPWITQTPESMPKSLGKPRVDEGLPISTVQDVANVSAGVLCDDSLNGTSMYVAGGRAWEIEGHIDRLQPQWLGDEPSRTLAQGQKVLKEVLAA